MLEAGLESISSLQQSFNTKYGVRKFGNLSDPKVNPVAAATLPRRPLLHFIPDTDSELGIGPKDNALLLLTEDNTLEELELYVYHETKPTRKEGLTGTEKDEKKLIQDYHKKFTQFSRVFKLESALKSTLPVIVNYGLIEHCYPQQIRDPLRPWRRSIDILQTQWSTIDKLMRLTDRQQYVFYKVPKTLPDVERLKDAIKKQTVSTLKTFNERRDFYVFDLLSWFGGDFVETPDRYASPISKIKESDASRVTLVFLEDDDFTSVQLNELMEWKEKEPNPRNRLTKLYQVFNRLVELRTPVVVSDDTQGGGLDNPTLPTEPDLFVSIEEAKAQTDVKPTDYTKEVLRRVDELAENGQLSGREYKYLSQLPEKYKTFPNPFANLPSTKDTPTAKESFEGLLKRSVDDVFGQMLEKTYPPIETVTNESYLKDRISGFDNLYVEKMLQKDLAATVMSLQKVGLPITKFEVTEVKDAVNHFQRFTIQTTPVNGQQSSFKFDIPVLDKEGVFINNGVKCRLNKQRADIPIVKTAPDECVLTSAMGKLFVRRTPRVAYNLEEWVVREITLNATVTEDKPEVSVTQLRVKSVFKNDWKVPYGYSIFARKFIQFTTQGIDWFWDYPQRLDHFSDLDVKSSEIEGRVVCGRKGKSLVVVDKRNQYFLIDDKTETYLGDIAQTFGLNEGKKPLPFAETKVFGKTITVGIMLAYLLGIEKLFAQLKVRYDVVDKSVRRTKQPTEMVLVFKDVRVFVRDLTPTSELILGGLAYYATPLKEMDFNDLNQRGGYTTVLGFRGLGVHHQRECELMELMWVDPITELLLTNMKEPTTFIPLLVRACMLITTDDHADESDPLNTVNKGYSRMVEMVYRELMSGVRDYRNESARKRNTMSINPQAVKLAIIQDEAVALVEESNPIHNAKEKERVTFNGSGGRSSQTLMGRHRVFHEHDLGFAGEGTTDNGKAGTIFYTSADPNYTSLYGTIRKKDDKDGDAAYVSSTTLVLPFATYDDGKRTVFAQIQASSWANSVGMRPYPVRTSYDTCFAHRVGRLYAFPAEEAGVIKRITDTTLMVTYKSGKEDSCKIGRVFGRAAGKVIPHELICDLKEGAKFAKGDILAFNRFYFTRDWLNPTQVTLLLGVPTIVAFRENMNTYEDASTISLKASQQYASYTSKCRDILVSFTDEVAQLVSVGDEVEYDNKLCTIVPGEAIVQDEEMTGLEGLQQLMDATPKAKVSGKVERIEVLYCGDIANASSSLGKLIRKDNARRTQLSKETNGEEFPTGAIEEPTFIANNYIAKNTALIRVYITHLKPTRAGDKIVFCNSIKSVPSAVFNGTYTTFKGLPVDATYSYAGIMNRIVESPKFMGVLAMILRQIGLNACALYRGKKLN